MWGQERGEQLSSCRCRWQRVQFGWSCSCSCRCASLAAPLRTLWKQLLSQQSARLTLKASSAAARNTYANRLPWLTDMLSARIKTGPGRSRAATGSQPVSLSMSFTWQHRPEPGPGTQTPSGPSSAQLGLVSSPCLPIARSPACLPCSLLPASRSCDPLPNVRDRLRLCLVIFFLPFLPCKTNTLTLQREYVNGQSIGSSLWVRQRKRRKYFKFNCFIFEKKTLIHTCWENAEKDKLRRIRYMWC